MTQLLHDYPAATGLCFYGTAASMTPVLFSPTVAMHPPADAIDTHAVSTTDEQDMMSICRFHGLGLHHSVNIYGKKRRRRLVNLTLVAKRVRMHTTTCFTSCLIPSGVLFDNLRV